ncbi:MAG: hypothetical protein JSV88_01255 [Candidatus Aminicenantes bacterium]|nr:MAG: hypothetical protein JSV88_01255 [Candidatus Aminicenantes bacterium]
MNKEAFLKLFEGNDELIEAAKYWWKEIENCDHPYGKLWFRHWLEETRAHPQIAFAFQKAIELGLNENSRYNLACEIFERLYGACLDEAAPKKIMGLFSGGVVRQNGVSEWSVTFIGIDVPGNAFDTDIEEVVNSTFQRRNTRGELAITWVVPIKDIPGQLKNDTPDIRLIRDRLGLPHMKKQDLIICLLWPVDVTADAHIPTILDGRWSFWRPSSKDEGWGKTMDLATGNPGCREGVIGGERHEWELVCDNGSPCRWHLDHEYDPGPDGRFTELCEFLLEKVEPGENIS